MRQLLQRASMLLASALFAGLMVVPAVQAADVLNPACQGNSDATLCKDNTTTQNTDNNSIYGPNGILTKAARIVSIIVGVAAVIVIVIAGLQYILSTGDPAKVESAKNAILYALVGLVVAAFAQVIIVFVIRRL